MSADLSAVKDAISKLVSEVSTVVVPTLNDLASKITNTVDPVELAALASQITDVATGLDTAAKTADPDFTPAA